MQKLTPSLRGEYEITDLNQQYLKQGKLQVEILGQGFTWMDMGTIEGLVEASGFVEEAEQYQKRDIACLEEIAFLNGRIRKKEIQ